jgi:hypothetical protein
LSQGTSSAIELWRSANQLLAVLYKWEAWWLEFLRAPAGEISEVPISQWEDFTRERGRGDDPGLPVHWSLIARDRLRAIFLHGAGEHVAPDASLEEVTGWLFRTPGSELEPIFGLTPEGRWGVVAQRYPPPWRVELMEWARAHLSAAKGNVSRLIGGIRGGLLPLLRNTPAAALVSPPQAAAERPSPPSNPVKPRWDGETRTLYWGNVEVRAYKRNPANRQIDLLEAFEAAGWPPTIPDPFRDATRLRQTVANLNEKLTPGTIRFHLDGTGDGVDWRPVAGNETN